MKKLSLSISFILFITFGYSQTDISGGIYEDTTWDLTGSPYIVTGEVVVFEGKTLTIDPGVVVKFDSGISLELRGKLVAIGTFTEQITFTSNASSPAQSDWVGIIVLGTEPPTGEGDQITMEYCNAEYAHTFVDLNYAYHGPYIFKNCNFTNNYQTNYDGGMPLTLFENCTFDSNHTALNWCQFESIVRNSTFTNNVNGVDGIKLVESCYFSGHTGVALSPYGSTYNCTVEFNNIGVSCPFNGGNDTFINNTVKDNSIGVEVLTFFNGGIDFYQNTICRNDIYNVKLLHDNNADLSNNCWCSTDSDFIRSTIFDGYVDISYGLVDFLPLSTDSDCTESVVDSTSLDSTSVSIEVIFDELRDALVYPNPFTNSLDIVISNSEPAEITIYTINGNKVFQEKFSDRIKINTEKFSTGFYYYEVHGERDVHQKGKLLKVK